MKIKILLTALLAALVLASCGETGNSSNDAPAVPKNSAASTESTDEVSTDSYSEDSSLTNTLQEPQDPPESEQDDSSEPDGYELLLASVDKDYSFMQASGDKITFSELLEQGYANVTADGQAYCLVKSGGGAGSVFFKVYYTENGGGSWEDGGMVSIFNGSLQLFPLEDGRIIAFDKVIAAETSNPYVYLFRHENKGVVMETDERYFDGLVLDDGTKLAPGSHVDVQGKYLGNYKIHLTVTGEDGKVLLDSDAALDSVDLGLIKSDAAQ